jgi:TolB-like protein
VNVVARLQELAEPGGVCVSGAIRDQVGDRLGVAFADLGSQNVKNLARPIRVFRVRLDEDVTAAARAGGEAACASARAAANKPSIAVLPFVNMSGDPEQEFFADGLTEDTITALSRFRDLFVISRNSAFVYKGKAVKLQEVTREFGVEYVLESSVRKVGRRSRSTPIARLIIPHPQRPSASGPGSTSARRRPGALVCNPFSGEPTSRPAQPLRWRAADRLSSRPLPRVRPDQHICAQARIAFNRPTTARPILLGQAAARAPGAGRLLAPSTSQTRARFSPLPADTARSASGQPPDRRSPSAAALRPRASINPAMLLLRFNRPSGTALSWAHGRSTKPAAPLSARPRD